MLKSLLTATTPLYGTEAWVARLPDLVEGDFAIPAAFVPELSRILGISTSYLPIR